MGKLTNIVIHCIDTPPKRIIDPEEILIWHTAPKKLKKGKIKYWGKEYKSIDDVPLLPEHIGKFGDRGWDRPGYAYYVRQTGEIEKLHEVDEDDYITFHERTWGAAGYNANSIHVAIEGGWNILTNDRYPSKNELWSAREVMSSTQMMGLNKILEQLLELHPDVKVCGHYNLTDLKTCPNFDVNDWCLTMQIPKKNVL